MRSFTTKNIFTLVLLTAMLVVTEIGMVMGQTKTYLLGQKTGGQTQAGSLIGLGPGNATVSSPMLTEAWGCGLLGAQTNQFRFYYGDESILTNSTTNATTLKAARSFGLLGVLGSGADVYFQIRNTSNNPIPANTPTYFKLKDRPTNVGISLDVGGLLGLVELQSITGVAYTGAANYKLNTATTNLACSNPYNGAENPGTVSGTSITKLLIDPSGEWYARVVPDAAYNSVRLNVAFPSGLSLASVNAEINVNVYNAFTMSSGGTCSINPIFTSPGEATGVTINTGVIGGLELSQLVANPQYAINGVAGQYSSFSSGLASIGVANTVSQTFYYDHTTTANDGIHVNLGLSNSLIGLSLLQLNGIVFYAYSGSSETPVYTKGLGDLASLLGLDLLNLINIGSSQKKLDFNFNLGVPFDRFKIEFQKGLLGVGVIGDALRIYDVNIAPGLPTITTQPNTINSTDICSGSSANFSVAATVPSGGAAATYVWQYDDGTGWTNIPGATSSTYSTGATTTTMNNWLFRVLVTGGGNGGSCPPQTISSNAAKLTVKASSTAADISVSASLPLCEGNNAIFIPSSTTLTPPLTFKWYKDVNKTQPITSSGNFAIDANGKLTISNLPGSATPYKYYVSVSNSIQCENAAGTLREASVTINPLPSITLGPNPLVCAGIATSNLTYSATSNSPTTYNIVWNATAHSAGFVDVPFTTLPATPIIINVPTAAAIATYVGTITVKNANGCTSVLNNFSLVIHPKPTAPLIISQ